MAGFLEFSMMRVRYDINQKVLSELLYAYINVEEDFVKELFMRGDTQLGRVFVQEPVLSVENALHILDYERASRVIAGASHIGIGTCYCRHKMKHLGKSCDAPMEICMTFNGAAASLIKHGFARQVTAPECLDLLQQAYQSNLIQFGENVRRRVNFICNCCGCCCEAMIVARRFGFSRPVHTSAFIPVVDASSCKGCGKCVEVCPVEAMRLVSSNDPKDWRRKEAQIEENRCLGCGVCVRICPCAAIDLRPRRQRILTPLDTTQRTVVMAIERGKLQNLIFDNQLIWNHRALAAVFGIILRLPPIKQLMASSQMKSRYLETLIRFFKMDNAEHRKALADDLTDSDSN
jgi:ferredoxin